jgi:hypothetical protein
MAAVAAHRDKLRAGDRHAAERTRGELVKLIDGQIVGPILRAAARTKDPDISVLALARACACEKLASLVITLYFDRDGTDTDNRDDRYAVPLTKQIEQQVRLLRNLSEEYRKCEERYRINRRLK